MSYITTVSGKHFDPIHPDRDLIDIADIAHALSLMCRANGHMTHFYSVAQHCIACAREAEARGYSKEVIAGCLLHDASEAYLSDVTRPVKKDLTYYLEVEKNLQELIWEKLIGRRFSEEEENRIFAIDDQMLSMEFHLLMPEELDDSRKELKVPVSGDFVIPEQIEKEFLMLYKTTVSSGV